MNETKDKEKAAARLTLTCSPAVTERIKALLADAGMGYREFNGLMQKSVDAFVLERAAGVVTARLEAKLAAIKGEKAEG